MIKLSVKVVPGASRDQVAGWLGDALKVRVKAPPENGKANVAVVALLAKTLGLAKVDIAIVTGATSPVKTLEINNITREEMIERLSAK